VSPVAAADPRALAEWAGFAQRAPRATLFHEPGWCEAVHAAFGHRPRHLLARRAGRVVGVLPLMEIRSLVAGRLLVSVPYAAAGGPIGEDARVTDALTAAAVRLAHERRAALLDLRCTDVDLTPATRPFILDSRYASFVRALPDRVEELADFLPRKARAAARQARERDGLTVRHNAGDLPAVWGLYTRSMRRLGSIGYPYRFLAELAARFSVGPASDRTWRRQSGRTWVTTVWTKDPRPRLVAGVLSFVFRDAVIPYFVGVDDRVSVFSVESAAGPSPVVGPVSDRSSVVGPVSDRSCPEAQRKTGQRPVPRSPTGATNLLYLAVMERAVKAGLRRFDFGRTRRDNAGPFAFKCNQGFQPRDLHYLRYAPPGRRLPDLTPSNPRFATARRCWRHLPLSLTRALGGWLAGSFPG
jgi:hypothetical protein